MLKNRRLSHVLLGTAALLGLGLAFRPRSVLVESALVTRGPMTVTVDEEGRTRVRERFVVAAPIGGRLSRITLHEGDPVASAAILARIVSAPLDPRALAQARARVRAAEAARLAASAREETARAAFDQAHRDRGRAEQLGREGLEPVEGRERAASRELTAASELAAASHAAESSAQEVAEARAALLASTPLTVRAGGGVPVVSPVKGTLLRVLQESDRVVAAGTPLFEIGDLGDIEVMTELLSSDALQVAPGSKMLVSGLGGSEVFGRVRRVEPSAFTKVSALGVEEQRVIVVGDLLKPPIGIGDGYRVDVRVVVWEASEALLVPGSALFREGASWRLFVIERGRARTRTVEVGHRTATEVEVRGGLNEGESVVLYPGDRVSEGRRVTHALRD